MPHLVIPFAAFTALCVVLGATVIVLLRRQVFAAEGPPPAPLQAPAPDMSFQTSSTKAP